MFFKPWSKDVVVNSLAEPHHLDAASGQGSKTYASLALARTSIFCCKIQKFIVM
jgi:hypothetical protein